MINDKDHHEFFNRKTIYSDLIDKLDSLKLVEPLDNNNKDTRLGYRLSGCWLLGYLR